MSEMLGHSENSFRREPLSEHLAEVVRYATKFAEELGIRDEAIFTALLHDVGKIGCFQERLRGKIRRVDHWTFGAVLAKRLWGEKGLAAALAIAGHHEGLGAFNRGFYRGLNEELPEKFGDYVVSRPISDEELDAFLKSLALDPHSMTPPKEGLAEWSRRNEKKNAALMLDLRMLYSILVDADFLATEGHFNGTAAQPYYQRPMPPELEPEKRLAILLDHLEKLSAVANASSENVRLMRAELLADTLAAADEPIGSFTLTAPTGSGKTLAMLAFALKHAVRHHLKRIIVVIPFLSIIEQTAKVYRDILCRSTDSDSVVPLLIEDHSRAQQAGREEHDTYAENLATENWDAPIILTTNIQFFESLHSNRPSTCRKLHRLANSVILMDEIQSFPKELVLPTLGTLSRLPERYNTTLVMATATQPAFTEFDEPLRRARLATGWQPREIVGMARKNPNAVSALFDRAKRTNVTFWNKKKPTSWSELAKAMATQNQALCVVNLKRHAARLVEELTALLPQDAKNTPIGLYHLSTNLCPKHRETVLAAVRTALKAESDEPVLLVATQCIEAGVDVDFPVGWRALAPLDAIAQAAGRVNRNQKRAEWGDVFVFSPEREKENEVLYPPGYGQGADLFEHIMRTHYKESPTIPIEDPEIYRRYYRELYDVSGVTSAAGTGNRESALGGIGVFDFMTTAEHYRLIPNNMVNVLVPYAPYHAEFDALIEEVNAEGLTADWIRRARDCAVSVYRTGQDQYDGALHPIPLRQWGKADRENGPFADDWFYLIESDDPDRAHYDPLLGLCGNQNDFLFG